jgi:16S rRNA (cytosine1402-N4)-methyltransferase
MLHNQHNIKDFVDNDYSHKSIMLREILHSIENTNKHDGIFVDCTLGEGGHSLFLLQNFNKMKIIGFERDAEILILAKERLSEFENRVTFINDNFSKIGFHLNSMDLKADYILYDFGISSFHFDISKRGFAFKDDEPLDMRLGLNKKNITASYVVNNYTEAQLTAIFYRYGEENWSKHIAKIICERRKNKPISTSGELADIVLAAIPKKFHVKNIHPATRIFQAIRIEVNDELSAIEKSLNESYKYCNADGLIMAISFHSLEDRIVKDHFKRLSRGCLCFCEPKDCMCANKPFVEILTKKPITPSEDEIEFNKRARSAKLRVCRIK